MKNLFSALSLSLFFVSSFANAARFERVDSDLKNYDTKVAEIQSDFEKTKSNVNDKEWVKSKLNFMVEVDQFMRSMWQSPIQNNYTPEETVYFKTEFLLRNDNLDSENTADLKKLLKIYSWFTISDFGTKADSQAWLIVQHADLDPNFQNEVLAVLTDLLPKKETNPQNYAYLFDRIAASWNDQSKRKLQRYGTQGQCLGLKLWEPIPMEEPHFVDERRASVGLNTIADYKNVMKEFCY